MDNALLKQNYCIQSADAGLDSSISKAQRFSVSHMLHFLVCVFVCLYVSVHDLLRSTLSNHLNEKTRCNTWRIYVWIAKNPS